MFGVGYRIQNTRKRIKNKEKGCHNPFHTIVHPSTNQDQAWAYQFSRFFLYKMICLCIEQIFKISSKSSISSFPK